MLYLKMLKRLFYFVVMSIALFSCGDCLQHAKAIIVDKESKKPIDNVYVHKIGEQYGTYSDSRGFFEIHEISGGLMGCRVLKLGFYKEGYYAPEEEAILSDTVYMTRTHHSK